MFEVDGDLAADVGLDLPKAPIGPVRIADEHTGLEKGVHIVHTASAYPGTFADPAPDLGALVGSRICHDLISPLGAIGNGVELIALSGVDDTPEMALIAESVENANARIRFFRVAFGAAEVEQTIGAQEVAAVIEGLGRTGRHRIDWTAGGGPRIEVKLVFLVILCISSAMPWGGTIRVRSTGEDWHGRARPTG